MTVRELGPGETALAFEAMRALRPHLADEGEFVRRVDERQRPQGYRLVGVVEDDGRVSAVAGFRVLEMLAYARILYVDDLSTLPAPTTLRASCRTSPCFSIAVGGRDRSRARPR